MRLVPDREADSVAADIRAAVARVEDPEIPVTLADLGVVRALDIEATGVRVVLRTTRLACPGRQRMAADVEAAVTGVVPGLCVDVEWDTAPWRPEDATEAGRQALRDFGYVMAGASRPSCPYCGAGEIRPEGLRGGSPCKVPFTCRRCGSPFDALAGSVGAGPVFMAPGSTAPDGVGVPVDLPVRAGNRPDRGGHVLRLKAEGDHHLGEAAEEGQGHVAVDDRLGRPEAGS
jgi:ring-1,2-phenylacetyl-CoA epoxidase subunit PaaD